MSRDRRTGRFTAERTTKTTHEVTDKTTHEVTERFITGTLTDHSAGDPTPVFTLLIRCPPAGARWAHADFYLCPQLTATQAAAAPATEPFTVPAPPDTAPIPVIRVPVARTYPELEPATLALEFEAEVTHEFTEANRDRLAFTLTEGYLP